MALTSPYQAFGVALDPGAVVPGAVPCNGAVLRFQPADPAGTLEVFAWGLRNPYGVVVDDEGALWVIDNGPDARGSRPIENAPDAIYRLEEADAGTWYGYPDFFAGIPVTDEAFAVAGRCGRWRSSSTTTTNCLAARMRLPSQWRPSRRTPAPDRAPSPRRAGVRWVAISWWPATVTSPR